MTQTSTKAGATAVPAAPRRGAPYAGDLRRDLLDAALEIVASEGPEALTVRAVASRVGVSHAAPGRWYPTKRHLLTAIATEAFRLLVSRIAEAQEHDDGRAGPLHSAALAYLSFAQELPGHFTVMWRDDLLLDDPDLLDAGMRSLDQFLGSVHAALRSGWAAGRDAEAVADLAWSSVHGLALLRLSGPYQSLTADEFDARATAVLDLLERSLA